MIEVAEKIYDDIASSILQIGAEKGCNKRGYYYEFCIYREANNFCLKRKNVPGCPK